MDSQPKETQLNNTGRESGETSSRSILHFPNIIIGGGISGLYIAYQLYSQGESFCLLESSDRLGGRVYTYSGFELGASILHSNQKNIIKFAKELNIDLETLDSKWKTFRIFQGYTQDEVSKKFINLKKQVKLSVQKNELTVDEHARNVLTKDDYIFLKTCWPAWYETSNMNAFTYFDSFNKEGKYLKVKNGLSSIIDKCNNLLQDHIKLNSKVLNIICGQKYYITLENATKLTCDKLFLCTSLKSANEIKFESCPELSQYLSLCKYQSCLRFYVKFKSPVLSNFEFTNICGHIKSGWIVKIDDYTVLGPYVDGVLADTMKSKSEQQIINDILEDLKTVGIKTTIENVDSSVGAYWEDAIEILKPEFYTKNAILFNISDTLKCTVLPKPIDQGWLNGVLYNLHTDSGCDCEHLKTK
jgi:protoporphyrinogen oxidase